MYIVMEIQKNGEQVATLVDSYTSYNQAKSKYHTVLAAAAISSVEQHSAALLDDTGVCIVNESYAHPVEVEPTPESEGN